MKNTLEVMDEMYQVLKVSQLKDEITGLVYKNQRPDDSKLEDVVINSLPITEGTMQRCIVNINIYIPDLQVQLLGKPQQQPDFERLKTLTEFAILALEEYYAAGYSFYISSQSVFREQDINQHYTNIRIEYGSFANS